MLSSNLICLFPPFSTLTADFFYIANKITLYVCAIGFPTVYNQLQVVNNKSFSLSAAADASLLSCLGTRTQNGVSRLQEFKSHLLHFIISIDFLKKSFVFQYFCITCFNDNRVKKMGEGRSFQVVVSSLLPQTKQSFSHSDD